MLNEQLIEAIKQNNLDMVKDAIEKGADVNTKDPDGSPALLLAYQDSNYNIEIIKYLISEGADLSMPDSDGYTMLMYAVLQNDFAMVAYLVDEKVADVNAQSNHGNTALMLANSCSDTMIAEYLVYQGAKLDIKNKDGKTALSFAYTTKNFAILEYLMKNLISKEQLLIEAIKQNNLEMVRYAIEKGADVNTKDLDGSPALFLAYQDSNYNIEIIKYLISENADLSIPDSGGYTMLMYAVLHNDFDMVKYLVDEKDADINVQSNLGSTALMMANSCSDMRIAEYLVFKGAKLDIKNKDGKTALSFAYTTNNPSMFEFLIGKGINTSHLIGSILKSTLNKTDENILGIEQGKMSSYSDMVRKTGHIIGLNDCDYQGLTFAKTKFFEKEGAYSDESLSWIIDAIKEYLNSNLSKFSIQMQDILKIFQAEEERIGRMIADNSNSFETIATEIIQKIPNNPVIIFSGWKGHAIAIAFCPFKGNNIQVIYSNRGEGHPYDSYDSDGPDDSYNQSWGSILVGNLKFKMLHPDNKNEFTAQVMKLLNPSIADNNVFQSEIHKTIKDISYNWESFPWNPSMQKQGNCALASIKPMILVMLRYYLPEVALNELLNEYKAFTAYLKKLQISTLIKEYKQSSDLVMQQIAKELLIATIIKFIKKLENNLLEKKPLEKYETHSVLLIELVKELKKNQLYDDLFTPVLEELSKSKINLFTRFIPQDPELLEIKYLNMLNVSPKNPEYIKMVKDVMKHNSNKQLLNLYSKIFQRIHNDDSDYDNIPLIEAIIADNLDFLKYIIEVCGANINATAYQGKTALILASENGNLSMVKYLIEQNADKSIKSYGSKDTALRLAFKKGYGEIVRYIIPTTQPNLVGNDLPKKETKFTRRRRSI